jgi:HK97 gp10 family phage protein
MPGVRVVKVAISEAAVRGELDRLLVPALERGCAAVQKRATQIVPVRTGRLKSSITTEVESGGPRGPVGYVGSNVEYAIFVEAGTHRMSARPYLLPALDAIRGGLK